MLEQGYNYYNQLPRELGLEPLGQQLTIQDRPNQAAIINTNQLLITTIEDTIGDPEACGQITSTTTDFYGVMGPGDVSTEKQFINAMEMDAKQSWLPHMDAPLPNSPIPTDRPHHDTVTKLLYQQQQQFLQFQRQ
eukprot:Ihof_evm3s435 gene=Ihof_evmTU3s435